ncbi:MAG: divalent-cation tolerance protein CutA [Acidobacteriota bacterium]|nr:divalent-cation tolerance protein CutA [Acidobacteriota bacterium]
MDDFVLVLTTYPADGDADGFARALVDERLAACVSVLPPMQSFYRWKGEVETASERQVLIKTKAAHVAALEQRVQALHPYEVPEFLVLDIGAGSPAYLSWLNESTGQESTN